ncbi:GNAT family N-acetyltransferase [Dyadobacter tibetensis]|uniref:GNAT family N-acetyltransferase n=1 Tax=Dyadobacter tibetensis TaxID=1211851 RepID=UPI000470DCC1|nr:GNAT family N-acetyltransferase [Dyadobacter tibetensis]
MNINLLSRQEIDPEKWEQYISGCYNAVIYAASWYLDLVCPRWAAFVWEESGKYQAVMPVPLQRKFGVWVVQQPFYCQYLGVFSEQPLNDKILQVFVNRLCSTFRYISTYSFCPENGSTFGQKFRTIDQVKPDFSVSHTHWLIRPDNIEDIFKTYSSERRRDFRRAKAFTWDLEMSSDPQSIIDLFRRHHEGKMKGEINGKAYALLESIVASAALKNSLWLGYARKCDMTHAGALILMQYGRAIYLFNASDVHGRKGHARTWLLTHYLTAMAAGSIFDFESPDIKTISKFYRGFGAKPMPFVSIQQNRLYFPFNVLQAWRKWFLIKFQVRLKALKILNIHF